MTSNYVKQSNLKQLSNNRQTTTLKQLFTFNLFQQASLIFKLPHFQINKSTHFQITELAHGNSCFITLNSQAHQFTNCPRPQTSGFQLLAISFMLHQAIVK